MPSAQGLTALLDRAGASSGRLAVAAGLLAAVLSVAGSWIPSFWGDEAASILSARRPLGTLPELLDTVDAVHGTYYVVLHVWIDLFGFSPFAARLPSSIAVGVIAAGAVVLARQLAGGRVAVLAGAIVVLLPRLTLVGIETRSFALSAALITWATVLLVAVLNDSRPKPVRWLAYAVLMIIAGYLFLFSLLLVPAHAVLVGMHVRRRGWSRGGAAALRWLAASVIVVIAVAPLADLAYAQRAQLDYLRERPGADPYAVLVTTWFGNPVYAVLAIALILAPVVATFAGRAGRRLSLAEPSAGSSSLGVGAAVALAFVPMALLLVGNLVEPVYTHRYLVGSAPAVAIVMAATLARLRPRALIAGVLLLTLSAAPTYASQRTPFAKVGSDWAQFSRVIHDNASPGDALVFDETTPVSRRPRLAQRVYPADYTGLRNILLDVPYFANDYWWDRTYKVPTVSDRFADVDTVWAVQYRVPGGVPDDYQMAELAALGFRISDSWECMSSVVYKLTR